MTEMVERMAKDYADTIAQLDHHKVYCIDDFKAGMEAWIEIKRDKDGFAEESCLEEMFANMPFVIYDRRYNDADVVNDTDWRGEIDTKPRYSHWKPLILPKKK